MSTSRTPMGDLVIAAVIIGASIIIAVAINIYFSPFHTCVRACGGCDDQGRSQPSGSHMRDQNGEVRHSR